MTTTTTPTHTRQNGGSPLSPAYPRAAIVEMAQHWKRTVGFSVEYHLVWQWLDKLEQEAEQAAQEQEQS